MMALSTWARKYGRHEKWQNKSGFTPIRPKLPTNSGGSSSQGPQVVPEEDIEKYQRDQLYEFTTQELVDLDVISSRKLRPSNLGGEIMPFLRRDRWYNGTNIGGDAAKTYGFSDRQKYPHDRWIGSNQNVWKIMEPSILIATKMFGSPRVQAFVS
jgi:hypothetical protein